MESRQLGRTGLPVSVLSFGCGAVGGLMTRGDAREQERAVARALEIGITYFDSAALYGNGASETNLGRVLAKLNPSRVVIATKVRIPSAERGRMGDAIAGSLDASLKRLGRDHVDIFYCHNTIAAGGGGDTITLQQLLGDALPAFERQRQAGKARFIGITARRWATRQRCCRQPKAAPSTWRRSASTPSIPRPGKPFPRATRGRTTRAS